MLSGGISSAWAIAGTAVFRMVVSNASMKNPTATNQGNSRLAVALGCVSWRAGKGRSRGSGACECRVDDDLRLGKQFLQMCRIAEALGVNFVDIFGPRGPRCEPTAARGDFHATDGRIVAGGSSQNSFDRVAGEFGDTHLVLI